MKPLMHLIFANKFLASLISLALIIGLISYYPQDNEQHNTTISDNKPPATIATPDTDPHQLPPPDNQQPAQTVEITTPQPIVDTANYANGLKLLSYNVYLMNPLIANWQHDHRVDKLLQSEVMNGHDAIILSELFENKIAQRLLDGLKKQYPHQTPVLGRSQSLWNETLGRYRHATFEDGGVAIISRWPIKEQIQYIYRDGCGADALSNKGFVYVNLDKNGADYHVIGTHVQAEDSTCSVSSESVRKNQFAEIQAFIRSKNIPLKDVVFIGGDFNVIKDSHEYTDMLETLQVNAPDSYAGLDATWDSHSNGLASFNYPNWEKEYLDYIFVAKNHAQPEFWHNQALDVTTTPWKHKNNRSFVELSDHYPVVGFAYADSTTRTHSYRDMNEPYSDVKLRNKANGLYIKINSNDNDGWLRVDGTNSEADSKATSFNIDTWYPKNRAFCIKNNDYIQVQGNERTNSYWNWWLGGGSGNYAYFTKDNNASDRLRVRIMNDDGDCLKNGDDIAFVDTNTVNGQDYYLQRRSYGKHENHLYLASDTIGDNETFTVEMAEGKKQDWTDKLRYK